MVGVVQVNESFFTAAVLFIIAMVGGFIALKYLERRLGLVRMQSENEEEDTIIKPPAFVRINDLDYIVDWFVRRDKKIDNPLLLRMNIVDNLVEENTLEIDTMMSKRYKFNRYLGDLVDLLPKIEQAEQVLSDYYRDQEGEDSKDNYLGNIKSYVTAKIRISGWLYYQIYGKFYNQRESGLLDYTEYFLSEVEAGRAQEKNRPSNV